MFTYVCIYSIHYIKLLLLTRKMEVHNCSICLENVTNVPLKCGHAFHDECVLEWFKINNTCPNCRCVIMTINKSIV